MFARLILCLSVLWLLGVVTSYTLGGFIHVLPAIAIVAILIRFVHDRRAALPRQP